MDSFAFIFLVTFLEMLFNKTLDASIDFEDVCFF